MAVSWIVCKITILTLKCVFTIKQSIMCKTSSLPEQFSYTLLHTVNKPSKFILREILPFFYNCRSQFSKVLTLRVTMVKSLTNVVPHTLYGVHVRWHGRPRNCIYRLLLLVLIHNPSSMWSGVVIHVERTTCQWMVVKMRNNDISQYGIVIHLSVHSAIKNIKVQPASWRKATPHSYTVRTKCTCWKDVVFIVSRVYLSPNAHASIYWP